MSETPKAPAARPASRARLVWATGATVLIAAALGWLGWRQLARPVPPPVPAGTEEAVATAIEQARAAVLADPADGASWGALAETFLANGYALEAEPCLERADQLDPDRPAWPYLLALHHLRYDRARAVAYLRRAAERARRAGWRDTTPGMLLAEMELENGAVDAAQALCEEVLARAPDEARALLLRGTIAAAADDLAGSAADLMRAAGNPAARKRAYIQLAIVQRRLGEEDSARDYVARAQALPPEPGWPDPVLAEVGTHARGRRAQKRQADRYKAQGLAAERISVLHKLADRSTEAGPAVDLALALIEAGDHAGAEQALREALRRQPDRFNAGHLLAVTLFEQGEVLRQAGASSEQTAAKYRAAADAGRALIARHPDRALAYYYLGRSLRRLNRPAEAADALRQAVRLRPHEVGFRLELADALADGGQLSAAIAQLEEAQSFIGDSTRVRERLRALRQQSGPPPNG